MKRKGLALLGIVLALIGVIYSLRLGALPLTWAETFDGILRRGDVQANTIIHELRLPRALMALICGGVLASSGVIAQAILRNPMAAPSLIGISAGAGFTAALAIVFPIPFLTLLPNLWKLPIAAFIGSTSSAFLVFSLARSSGKTDTAMILLAGLAINSLAGAGTGLLTFIADDPQLRNISFWNLGSVAGAEWPQIGVLLLFTAPLILSVLFSGSVLNAWMLGEDEAHLLGVNVERQKTLQMLIISMAVGASVSFTGVISFIGLVVPHLLRMLLGPDHKQLLPQSFIWGAVLLVVSDLIARVVVVPLELPIGIVTALVGSPYFVFLLRQQFKRSRAYDPA